MLHGWKNSVRSKLLLAEWRASRTVLGCLPVAVGPPARKSTAVDSAISANQRAGENYSSGTWTWKDKGGRQAIIRAIFKVGGGDDLFGKSDAPTGCALGHGWRAAGRVPSGRLLRGCRGRAARVPRLRPRWLQPSSQSVRPDQALDE